MTAITDAGELAALVDTLIPGDELFPSAAAVGTHGLVGPRLRQLLGGDGLARLSAALGPLAALDRAAREAAVARLEATLNARGGARYEVLNAGVGGWGTGVGVGSTFGEVGVAAGKVAAAGLPPPATGAGVGEGCCAAFSKVVK